MQGVARIIDLLGLCLRPSAPSSPLLMPCMSTIIGKAVNEFATLSKHSSKTVWVWQQWLTVITGGSRVLVEKPALREDEGDGFGSCVKLSYNEL